MNLLYLLVCLTFSPCQDTSDFTTLVDTCKYIAERKLDADGFGFNYDKVKTWIVYDNFIENKQLKLLCGKSGQKGTLIRDTCLQKICFGASSSFKVVNDANSLPWTDSSSYKVRFLYPLKNSITGNYCTVLWIKQNTYTSGFQLFIEYKYEKKEVVIISINSSSVTDVFEDGVSNPFSDE